MNKDYTSYQPEADLLAISNQMNLLLKAYDHSQLSPGEIASLLPQLTKLIPSPDEIAIFHNDGYQRRSLWKGEYFEVLLLCWQDGQHSQIHDHQGSNCGFTVLKGQVTERFFEQTANPSIIKPSQSRKLDKGGSSISQNGEGIHQLLNLPGNPPLITLHIYSNPLGEVNIYSLEKKNVEKFSFL